MLRTSLLVAAAFAALAATPDSAQAQRRGYGGGGYRGGYYGGYGIGNYGYGNYGYGNYGGYRGGYGYRPYYSNYGYGYSPYYSGGYYNSYPSTVNTYPNNTYSAYPSGAYVQQPISGNTTSFYGGDGQMAANQVTVRVILPTPDAQLMVQDQMNQASGQERIIISPALQPDVNYHYTFKATWRDQNGQDVAREKKIDVKAGQQYTVDFNQQ